jgi:hypothetical protein
MRNKYSPIFLKKQALTEEFFPIFPLNKIFRKLMGFKVKFSA